MISNYSYFRFLEPRNKLKEGLLVITIHFAFLCRKTFLRIGYLFCGVFYSLDFPKDI